MKCSCLHVHRYIIGLSFLLPMTILNAQDYITFEGDIFADTRWSADTIKVTGNIYIADNRTLTIDPGTYVEFQGWYNIEVKGTVIAVGSPGDTIVFTCHPDSTSTGWGGFFIADYDGHMLDNDSSSFSYCKFEFGIAESFNSQKGGAVFYVDAYSRLTITHSVFHNNYSWRYGGCIRLYGHADILLKNCYFTQNSAPEGSAVTCWDSDPLIENNRFISNSGSPLFLHFGARPHILNNIIGGNELMGIYCFSSNPVISGNIIVNNGDGIFLNGSNPTIVNNTICKNSRGIFLDKNSKPNIYNGIFWNNEQQVTLFNYESQPNFYNCNIQGGQADFSGVPDHTGVFENNIDAQPMFVFPSTGFGPVNFSPDADWSLMVNSPCINSGSQDMSGIPISPNDIDGNPRISYNRIDMGGIEFHKDYDSICGPISSDTTYIADTLKVFCNITIDNSKTLTILPGTIVEFQDYLSINVQGAIHAIGTKEDTICFTICDTTGFSLPEDPSGGWAGIAFNNSSGQMFGSDTSIFHFCKFQNSKTIDRLVAGGGAIRSNSYSKIKIDNCTFINNSAAREGGALMFHTSDLLLRNCYFENNRCYVNFGGAAVYFVWGNHAIIENNIFYKNNAGKVNGGAIHTVYAKDISIVNNVFSNNSARKGGAIFILDTEASLVMNNLICNNTADECGGIYMDPSSDVTFINNTVVNNSGGGVAVTPGSALMANSIIRGNQPYQLNITDLKSQPDIYYSNIEGGRENFEGEIHSGTYSNNLDTLAYFTRTSEGVGILFDGLKADWSLRSVSPCINMGWGDIPNTDLTEFDIKGNPRINGLSVDIGAYENQSGDPVISKQPNNYLKCTGESVMLEVKTDDDVHFQWQKNEMNISGATERLYKIDSLGSEDAGSYQCLVSNAYNSISSANVFLNIRVPPKILSQPGEKWVEKDKISSMRVFASGTDPAYQWRKDEVDIPGAVTDELSITQTGFEHEGSYDCIIKNSCGSDTTTPAMLYIAPQLCMVTVSTTSGNNLVIWEKEGKAHLLAYNIYRESQAAGIYDLMATVPYDDVSIYTDTTADPTVQAYLYKITALDYDENETDIDLCKPHKTIHLIVSTNPEKNTTQLQWDRYYGFDYQTYTIYRSSTGTDFEPIYTLSSSLNSWTDPAALKEDQYYRIAVNKPNACYPSGGGLKAGAGAYQQSMSNLEDNKLKDGQLPPDTITLSKLSIQEENLPGTMIGKLLTLDADLIDSHSYQFVPGEGDDDNLSFTLLGDLLLASESFDFEIKNQYQLRIRSTDLAGNYCEVAFIIQIIDIDETTGLPQSHTGKAIIYPNPFNQSTTITFQNPEAEPYRMLLTDLSGKLIRIEKNIRTEEFILKREGLENGIYLIELIGSKTFRGKIVIR